MIWLVVLFVCLCLFGLVCMVGWFGPFVAWSVCLFCVGCAVGLIVWVSDWLCDCLVDLLFLDVVGWLDCLFG